MKSKRGITIVIPSIGRISLKSLLFSIHQDSSLADHEILIVVHSRLIDELSSQYKAFQCLKYVAQDIGNISKSRNLGIKSANYELISLIDDDDFWVDGRVKTFKDLLALNSNSIVFGSAIFINTTSGKEKKLGRSQEIKLRDFLNQFQTFYITREKFFLQVGNCAFLKKSQVPAFNEKIAYLEDQIWILELLISGFTVFQTSEVTLRYFFSRNRSNDRWSIENEKEMFTYLSSLDKNLARSYINRKSLKSLSLSGDRRRFTEAKSQVKDFFGPNIYKNFSISFYSLIVYLTSLIKRF